MAACRPTDAPPRPGHQQNEATTNQSDLHQISSAPVDDGALFGRMFFSVGSLNYNAMRIRGTALGASSTNLLQILTSQLRSLLSLDNSATISLANSFTPS